jgi:hypothetical protein
MTTPSQSHVPPPTAPPSQPPAQAPLASIPEEKNASSDQRYPRDACLEDENLFRASRKQQDLDWKHNQADASREPSLNGHHHYRARTPSASRHNLDSMSIAQHYQPPSSANGSGQLTTTHALGSVVQGTFASCDAELADASRTEPQITDAVTGQSRPRFQLTPKTRPIMEESALNSIRKCVDIASPMLDMLPEIASLVAAVN